MSEPNDRHLQLIDKLPNLDEEAISNTFKTTTHQFVDMKKNTV